MSLLITTDLLSSAEGVYVICGGFAIFSGYVLWTRYKPGLTIAGDNFERTLEILGKDQSTLRRVQAKIDTAADHSLISQAVTKGLGLPILPLTKDDPANLVLADDRIFQLKGKVSVRFHGINPRGPELAFRFGKYENVATFYVPADTDISCFDVYLGTDNIRELQLQRRNFFASKQGLTPVGGHEEKTDLQKAMDKYDLDVTEYTGEGAKPELTPFLEKEVPDEHRPKPDGTRFLEEDHAWAKEKRELDIAAAEREKEKNGKAGKLISKAGKLVSKASGSVGLGSNKGGEDKKGNKDQSAGNKKDSDGGSGAGGGAITST